MTPTVVTVGFSKHEEDGIRLLAMRAVAIAKELYLGLRIELARYLVLGIHNKVKHPSLGLQTFLVQLALELHLLNPLLFLLNLLRFQLQLIVFFLQNLRYFFFQQRNIFNQVAPMVFVLENSVAIIGVVALGTVDLN